MFVPGTARRPGPGAPRCPAQCACGRSRSRPGAPCPRAAAQTISGNHLRGPQRQRDPRRGRARAPRRDRGAARNAGFGRGDPSGGWRPPESGLFSFAPGNGCYLLFRTIRRDGASPIRVSTSSRNRRRDTRPRSGSRAWASSTRGSRTLRRRLQVHLHGGQHRLELELVRLRFILLVQQAGPVPDRLREPLVRDHPRPGGRQGGVHGRSLGTTRPTTTTTSSGALATQPQLVTISMVGNDLLDVEPSAIPTQSETNKMVAELIDARQNLQEAISALVARAAGRRHLAQYALRQPRLQLLFAADERDPPEVDPDPRPDPA